MNAKSIPKSIWAFLVLLVVFLVLFFVLFYPTIMKISTYNATHNDAKAQIAEYEDYLSNKDANEKHIAELKEIFEKNKAELYLDASQSIKDLQDHFKEFGIDMTSLTRSESSVDSFGRTSYTGYPLYSASLSFSFNGTKDQTKDLIHYLERDSLGCYFINSLSMSAIEASDKYSVSMNVVLYYFDMTAAVATEAPAVEETTN